MLAYKKVKNSYHNIDFEYEKDRYFKIEEMSKSFKEDYEKNAKRKKIAFFLSTVFGIIIVFAMLSLIVYNYARINEIKYNIYSIENEINQLNIEVEELNSQLEGTIALDNIEKIATEELGMQYPQPEQILYINSQWNYALSESENFEKHSYDTNDTKIGKINDTEAIVIEKVMFYASKFDQFINK